MVWATHSLPHCGTIGSSHNCQSPSAAFIDQITRRIRRWTGSICSVKCPTGRRSASFLSYGIPARSPDTHPSQVLGAVTIGLWARYIVLLSSGVLVVDLITSDVLNVSDLSLLGTCPIPFSIVCHQPVRCLGVLVTGPLLHYRSFSTIIEGCDLVKSHLLCRHLNSFTRRPD